MAEETKKVTLFVEFTGTDTDLSKLTVTCDNEQSQTITKSGSIEFDAKEGSSIDFDGSSNGSIKLSIGGATEVSPKTLSYPPGEFNGGFIISKL